MSGIRQLVEKLTNAKQFRDGHNGLDGFGVRELKAYAKASQANVKEVVELLWGRIEAKRAHSLTKMGAILSLDVLMMRSAYARQLVCPRLSHLLRCAVLPPKTPTVSSERLKEMTLMCLERWNDKFGSIYAQLGGAIDFCRSSLRVELPSVKHERVRAENAERERQKQQRLRARFNRLVQEADDRLSDLEVSIEQCENAMAMLVDDVEQGEMNVAVDKVPDKDVELGRLGIPSALYDIEVVLDHGDVPANKQDSNSVLFDTIREHARVLERWVEDEAMSWEATLSQLADADVAKEKNRLLFWLIDVKTAARVVLAQCDELQIDLSDRAKQRSDESDSGDWEEGEDKDGFEEEYGDLTSSVMPPRPENDSAPVVASRVPTKLPENAYVAHFMLKNPEPGQVREKETREEMLKRAPVVDPSQAVLSNWGKDEIRVDGVMRQHRFYGEGEGNHTIPKGLADPSLTKYAVQWDGRKRRREDM